MNLDPRERDVHFELPELDELSDLDPRESHTNKVVTSLVIVVVVGAVLSAFTLGGLQNVVQTERTESLAAEAEVQAETAETLLTSLDRSAVSLATETSDARSELDTSEAVQTELRETYQVETAFSGIAAVHLIDTETNTVAVSSAANVDGQSASELGLSVPTELSPGETALRLRTGSNPAWVVFTGTASGDVLAQVTPYSYVQSELNGVLDESHTRLVNGEGTIVYDSESAEPLGSQHSAETGVTSPAVSAALDGANGARTLSPDESHDGHRVVAGYDAVDDTELAVVSYAEPSALFAAIGVVQRNLAILLGGIAVLLIGFGLVVERPAVRQLRSLQTAVTDLEEGDLDTAITTDRRDEFGDLARGLDSMRTDLRDRVQEAEHARDEAEAAKQEAQALSTELEAKADEYRTTLNRLAQGDFTARVDADSRHDGMREVGETINTVAADLETTLADVQKFADDVADSMELLTQSADQIEQSSGDVAETIQSLNEEAKQQRSRLQSVSTEMNDMSATVEEIASTSSEVASNAETAAELSREGQDAAENASAALDEIETVTQEAVGEVEKLVDRVEQIEEFADVIGDVAEQTDMLALNANIEAARTDTDADGFAVVADEIKSLATEAGERADDIEELVSEVGEQTDATAERMQEANRRVRESNDTVQSAIDALIEIGNAVESTNQGVQDINRATDDQATTTEEVTATVEEVEGMAARSASEMSQAAAAAEEQTATVSEVARTADEVAEEAESLREAAEQFTVDPDADDGPDPTADGSQPAAADGGEPDDGV